MTNTSGQPPITTGEQQKTTVPTATLKLEIQLPDGRKLITTVAHEMHASVSWDNYLNLQRVAEELVYTSFKEAFK